MTVAFKRTGNSSFGDLVLAIAIPAWIRLASAPFAFVAVKTVDARTRHFQAALNAFPSISAVANKRLRAFSDLHYFSVTALESVSSKSLLAATPSFFCSERKSFRKVTAARIRLIVHPVQKRHRSELTCLFCRFRDS